jgi:hypothetical protein
MMGLIMKKIILCSTLMVLSSITNAENCPATYNSLPFSAMSVTPDNSGSVSCHYSDGKTYNTFYKYGGYLPQGGSWQLQGPAFPDTRSYYVCSLDNGNTDKSCTFKAI